MGVAVERSLGAAVSIRGLTKRYGNAIAARDVTIDVVAGEFLTLLGPSGSGKTTTLMMMAGFVFPDQGEILIGGRAVTGLDPQRRGLGMVFQNYSLFPHLTVAGNVAFPLEVRGLDRAGINSKVAEILALVQLTGLENRYPRQLSGGQQQRVALARALVYEPPVLLMDEPLGALDKQLREQMQLEIKRIQQRLGITVISVTHDQSEALTMSDRIAVMRDGRIEQIGRPDELYEHPVNRFVAEFLGESNVVEGQWQPSEGDAFRLQTAGGALFAVNPGSGHGQREAAPGLAAIRPEKLRLAGGADSPLEAGEQDMGCVVTEIIYVGDITRYLLAVEGVGVWSVTVQNRSGRKRYQPGDQVRLIWSPRDMWALAE